MSTEDQLLLARATVRRRHGEGGQPRLVKDWWMMLLAKEKK
jgi:hypothetical protein